MSKKYKRSQYLINPAFQLDVIKKFIVLVFFNIISFYWIVYYFFFNLESLGKMVKTTVNIHFLFVGEQKNLMVILFNIIAVINIAVILLTGILVSHKVAGPLYRLKKFLDEKDILDAERINLEMVIIL